jgi:Bacterial sugar transferase
MGTLELLASLNTGVAGSILAVECVLLAEPLSNFLVRQAARMLPESEREHYESEWLQIVRDIRSPIGKLTHAISLCIRARSIALALGAPTDDIYSQATVRAFDILSAASFIFLLLPLWIGIAISIKLGSSGPVLLKRLRLGKGGSPFFEYNFRTFVMDGHNYSRTTSVGRLLRRTNIDLTPQLLNVLMGHMSLVGPRLRHYPPIDDLPSINVRPGIAPPVEADQGKFGLRTWLKTIWSVIKGSPFWRR